MVGDGSYMMMNSEIATSVMLGAKLTIVVLDNRGFGCINRLQMATGGANFNNLLKDTQARGAARDRLRRARRLDGRGGAQGRLDRRARGGAREAAAATSAPRCIVIDTDPLISTDAGGHWWDVAVPEVSRAAAGERGAEGVRGGAEGAAAVGDVGSRRSPHPPLRGDLLRARGREAAAPLSDWRRLHRLAPPSGERWRPAG